MCMSSPKSPTPVKVAQAPPVTASTPEFETELAEVDTAAQQAGKKKMGKGKLKVAPKDPSLSVGGVQGGSGSGNGVNVST